MIGCCLITKICGDFYPLICHCDGNEYFSRSGESTFQFHQHITCYWRPHLHFESIERAQIHWRVVIYHQCRPLILRIKILTGTCTGIDPGLIRIGYCFKVEKTWAISHVSLTLKIIQDRHIRHCPGAASGRKGNNIVKQIGICT